MFTSNTAKVCSLTDCYLDLLKKSLTDSLHQRKYYWPVPRPRGWAKRALFDLLGGRGMALVRELDPSIREEGGDRPPTGEAWLEVTAADTLLGLQRLNNLQWCVEDVLSRGRTRRSD
jgi:hypothetical protein